MQRDLEPFTRRLDDEVAPGLVHNHARPRNQTRHARIVARRVVVKQEELLRLGRNAEGNAVLDATVAPADVCEVFLLVELRAVLSR